MNALDLILLDLKETRRRFLKVAQGIPAEYLTWRPDAKALSIGEMIRHVLLHDLSWYLIFTEGRLLSEEEQYQWKEAPPYTTVEAEIERTEGIHQQFIEYVSSLDPQEFDQKMIEWPHRPIMRKLGDTLERKSYHDAVHTGQLLQYLRMLQIDRPDIWD